MTRSMNYKLKREKQMQKPATNAENIELIVYKIDEIKKDVAAINSKLDKDYVTKDQFQPVKENYVSKSEFQPIRSIVVGLVTLALTAVAVAVINIVVLK